MLSPIRLLLAASLTLSLATACVPKKSVKPDTSNEVPTRLSGTLDASSRVAVMLPLTGKYAKASNAIRSGMELVNKQRPADQRPQLQYLDSGAGLSDALLSETATADLLIGPLTREHVETILSEAARLPRTVITLNQTSDFAPTGIFQFGLSPDEDGRQISHKAFDDGHRTASVLYADSGWGSRHLDGFTRHWQLLGGAITTSAAYPLDGDASQAVKQILQSPGDFVYIVAKPLKARELNTMLKYYGSARQATYISAKGYDRRLHNHSAGDLAGAWIPVMPITVPADETMPIQATYPGWETLEALPDFHADYGTFYALGADAMRLALNAYQLEPHKPLRGSTGDLYVDDGGIVRRQPLWLHYDGSTITTAGPYPPN